MFLTGATLSAIGVLLRCASESRETSDSALACTIVGMTLMGLVFGEQFGNDYIPHIKAYFKQMKLITLFLSILTLFPLWAYFV